jgi:hypothetical protein
MARGKKKGAAEVLLQNKVQFQWLNVWRKWHLRKYSCLLCNQASSVELQIMRHTDNKHKSGLWNIAREKHRGLFIFTKTRFLVSWVFSTHFLTSLISALVFASFLLHTLGWICAVFWSFLRWRLGEWFQIFSHMYIQCYKFPCKYCFCSIPQILRSFSKKSLEMSPVFHVLLINPSFTY